MPIPDYQAIMLPLLKFTTDQKEHSLQETIDALADHFQLTEDERKELLPSGRQPTFNNRVGWARTYLKKAGLVESTKRGYFRITDRGIDTIKTNPVEINAKILRQFPEFLEFQNYTQQSEESTSNGSGTEINTTRTPEEDVELAIQKLTKELASDLLQIIKNSSPAFFEKLVVDLLVKMGYGGTRKDAGKTVGRSGDGGIDGIINEDRLGLDVIYIQAKRWENSVGRPEIQKFAGALQGFRAKKGVFITTSTFTNEAKDYVSRIDSKIVLIDGEMLTQLMIENNVGVTPFTVYEVKKVDSDYFTDS
ncbi:restriction endonuclease (plasmid) [Anabaena sp. FACHB-709]|uniref:Mrr restriction system protein n=3 Tax=Nostocaceae TaxID=1162 RepID=A0A1Z4KV07_ANAVA|nr:MULTISPECIES: restriction endonuclease [Nostocaceae]MBD2266133.1 restriction endonuclease [Anabaena sp. FACHB-709]BAY72682.1 mrr restriction system protein [Trichormus variabilis NIES-23]MBD2174383.1 restriction endonuclease [Anabaena cylindrica FACHB-318]MBD2275565.1 restriction endonuclease [Nostoc sp. PCC 7120 = FACHB-418]MBD2286469.1 restriction endonuclease [Anabaena cylindrica FACHB-170]